MLVGQTGDFVGSVDGLKVVGRVGDRVGARVGECEGLLVTGARVGHLVVGFAGERDGERVGEYDGAIVVGGVGMFVGAPDGTAEGVRDGLAVGASVHRGAGQKHSTGSFLVHALRYAGLSYPAFHTPALVELAR